MKPLKKVKIKWSPEFAYAIGILTTDGNLSPDGRHLNITSKDEELVNAVKKCLNLKNKIGKKSRGGSRDKKYFVLQFGDVYFYRFLLDIGLTPNKSKTLEEVEVPEEYFFDFLRGHLDGDGTFYSYWDPRWRSSFMFYTAFVSASLEHVNWLRGRIYDLLKIRGHITEDSGKAVRQLKYAKRESLILLRKIYQAKNSVRLRRKHLKIKRALSIIGEEL